MPTPPAPSSAPAVSTPAPLPPQVPVRPRRWLGWVLALLLIAALGGGAYWLVQRSKQPAAGAAGAGARGLGGPGPGGPRGAGRGGPSVTVGWAVAQQGELPVLVEALGTVTPQATVALVPQVTGTLTEVLFTEGQNVTKGQLLARIDPRPYEQTLAQAKATRARDEAQLAAAQVTLKRYQTLWQQDSIARQDVDTQAALVKQLAATVASDRASEQAAQLNLDHTRIVAPMAGRIGLRAVDPGNLVSSGGSTGIATIAQMDPITVSFAVPQERVPAVVDAQRAGPLTVTAMDRARSQQVGQGVFMTLDNAIDTSTGTVRAKARFANADGRLFPNQFVNVRLQLGNAAGVLVPVTAVRTGPQGDYAYVIDADGVAHTRAVKRGLATVDQTLITQGLQAGERVVTEGGDRVKDGARVQLQAPGAGGAAGAQRPQGRASGPWRRASGAAAAASMASAPGAGTSATNRAPAAAGPAQSATENAAGGGIGAGAGTGPAGGAGAAPAAGSGTPAPGAGSQGDAGGHGGNGNGNGRAAWLNSLPPAERDKIMAMQPEERRAYVRQLREQRQGSGAAPAN